MAENHRTGIREKDGCLYRSVVVVVTATTGMRGLALVILLQMEIGAAGVISAGSGADQFQCAIYIGSVLRTVSTVLAGTVLLSLFWTCPWTVPVPVPVPVPHFPGRPANLLCDMNNSQTHPRAGSLLFPICCSRLVAIRRGPLHLQDLP